MKALCIALAALCLFPASAQDQIAKKAPRVIYAPPSFRTAEQYLDLSESEKQLYVAGLIDGFFAMELFGASEATRKNFQTCTHGMDDRQITAIITKWIKDHPENWQRPASVESRNALNNACPGGLKIID